MKTLQDWKTLPEAAKRWGVTRAYVWRLITERSLIPEDRVAKVGDRRVLDPDFVESVGAKVDNGEGVLEAITEVLA